MKQIYEFDYDDEDVIMKQRPSKARRKIVEGVGQTVEAENKAGINGTDVF